MGFKGSEVQILSSRPNDEVPRWIDQESVHHFIENRRNADVAQSVERVLGKDEVGSSILLVSSIYPIAGLWTGDFHFSQSKRPVRR